MRVPANTTSRLVANTAGVSLSLVPKLVTAGLLPTAATAVAYRESGARTWHLDPRCAADPHPITFPWSELTTTGKVAVDGAEYLASCRKCARTVVIGSYTDADTDAVLWLESAKMLVSSTSDDVHRAVALRRLTLDRSNLSWACACLHDPVEKATGQVRSALAEALASPARAVYLGNLVVQAVCVWATGMTTIREKGAGMVAVLEQLLRTHVTVEMVAAAAASRAGAAEAARTWGIDLLEHKTWVWVEDRTRSASLLVADYVEEEDPRLMLVPTWLLVATPTPFAGTQLTPDAGYAARDVLRAVQVSESPEEVTTELVEATTAAALSRHDC